MSQRGTSSHFFCYMPYPLKLMRVIMDHENQGDSGAFTFGYSECTKVAICS
jgi:hypothetical protein